MAASRLPAMSSPRASCPVLVEIVGQPGAGKSLLARELVRRGEGRVHLCHLRMRRIDCLLHPRGWGALLPVVPGLLRAGRRRRDWKRVKRIASLVAWPQLVQQEAQKGFRIIIMDQGPVYCLIEEYLRFAADRDRRNLEWCLSTAEQWAATLDAIVWLCAPDTVLAERIHARAQPHPLKHRSGDDTVAWLAEQRANYERAMSMLMSHAKTPTLLRLDTALKCMEQTAEEVLATLASEDGQAPSEFEAA